MNIRFGERRADRVGATPRGNRIAHLRVRPQCSASLCTKPIALALAAQWSLTVETSFRMRSAIFSTSRGLTFLVFPGQRPSASSADTGPSTAWTAKAAISRHYRPIIAQLRDSTVAFLQS
jgi:hypothetical protein